MSKKKNSPRRALGIIGMIIGGIAILLLLSFGIMWLWNALMPGIFGLPVITYWQGVGLAVLGRLLLGGFGSGSDSGGKRKKRRPVRSEFKKEFGKEFRKAMKEECGKEMGEAWFDDAYEDWWEKEGRAGFEAFARNQKEQE